MATKTGRTAIVKSLSLSPEMVGDIEDRIAALGNVDGLSDYVQRLINMDLQMDLLSGDLSKSLYQRLEPVHTALSIAMAADLPGKLEAKLEAAETALNDVRQSLFVLGSPHQNQFQGSRPKPKAASPNDKTDELVRGAVEEIKSQQPPQASVPKKRGKN